MKEVTIQQVEEIVAVLTEDEKQLLKDTINEGGWGDAETTFLDETGKDETVFMYGYCTNDAYRAGHFKGRIISTMFRSIYKKLCPAHRNQVGRYVSHCNDWWGDGSGDMLFIRSGYYRAFEEWAKLEEAPNRKFNHWVACFSPISTHPVSKGQWIIKENNLAMTPVCTVPDPIGGERDEDGLNPRQRDNARLIAVAPELLELVLRLEPQVSQQDKEAICALINRIEGKV